MRHFLNPALPQTNGDQGLAASSINDSCIKPHTGKSPEQIDVSVPAVAQGHRTSDLQESHTDLREELDCSGRLTHHSTA